MVSPSIGKRWGYLIWGYSAAYILLGTLLFSNFYPFTWKRSSTGLFFDVVSLSSSLCIQRNKCGNWYAFRVSTSMTGICSHSKVLTVVFFHGEISDRVTEKCHSLQRMKHSVKPSFAFWERNFKTCILLVMSPSQQLDEKPSAL